MAITSRGGGGYQFATPGYQDTPLNDWMSELERRGYFANWLGRQGYLGTDTNSDFARSLQDRFEQGYQAEQFGNPDLTWRDYLARHTGKIKDIGLSMDDASRGIQRNRWVGGARWLPRSG